MLIFSRVGKGLRIVAQPFDYWCLVFNSCEVCLHEKDDQLDDPASVSGKILV